MTEWYDASTTMTWNRPPVGIVRTEIELLRHALERQDCKFFIFHGDGVKEVSPRDLIKKIQQLSMGSQPSLAKLFESRLPPLRAFRQALHRRISSLTPKKRHRIMRVALPINSIVEYFLQIKKEANLQMSSLRFQLQSEKAIRNLNRPATNLPTRQLEDFFIASKACGESCSWKIFGKGDVIFSAGLLWEFADLYAVQSEKNAHQFLFGAVCYDVIPINYPHLVPEEFPERFFEYMGNLLWLSDHIVCISEATRNDLLSFARSLGGANSASTSVRNLGDSIHTIDFKRPASLRETGKFILYVSTIEKRKNHQLLLQVLEAVHAELGDRTPELVFVGMKGWHVDEVFRDISLNPKLRNKKGERLVKVLNDVSDAELNWLYKSAQFTLFPSLYEGWGLPIAESLMHGTPVIASDRGALVEASQGLAVHLDPFDGHAWATKVSAYITNAGELSRAKNSAMKYRVRNWEDFAKGVFLDLEELAAKGTE